MNKSNQRLAILLGLLICVISLALFARSPITEYRTLMSSKDALQNQPAPIPPIVTANKESQKTADRLTSNLSNSQIIANTRQLVSKSGAQLVSIKGKRQEGVFIINLLFESSAANFTTFMNNIYSQAHFDKELQIKSLPSPLLLKKIDARDDQGKNRAMRSEVTLIVPQPIK